MDGWFPILGTYNERILVLDGFAGRGRYSDGSPGSPLIVQGQDQAQVPGAGRAREAGTGQLGPIPAGRGPAKGPFPRGVAGWTPP